MGGRLNHDDYTVAWIAVLPIEAEAALGMLDKRHDGQFESVRGDDYLYIGGEINGHNIVVATWPAGQNYGVGAAAALVNQVKARFSNLWFALLVGVAAGLPKLSTSNPMQKRDIRLGDVLVCIPDKASSGIVHYDLGKDTEDGFLMNGRQAETPAIVRSAISNIQLTKKKPFKKGNEFERYLDAFQASDDDNRFQCPSQETDRLFTSSVDATAPPVIVSREARDESERTRIWYGNIGSGNSMMRNPHRRDELRDAHDLIGLEMEAAGIMNTLPTGVIRGVCDYGDGQKNKDWQPYAAAVAAAYAKGILVTITPRGVRAQQDMKDDHAFPTFDPAGEISRNFVERPGVLQTISDCLERNPPEPAKASGPRVVVIHSLAGSGKSQIARKFASIWLERHKSFYWFDASSSSTLDQSFRDFARDAKIIDAANSSSDHSAYVRRKVCEWIVKFGGDWLLVYDNYDIMELREEDAYNISKYFPRSASGRIIVTTRNREVWTVTGGDLVDIGTMTEDEAIALFVKSANINLPDQASDEWAELREIACQLLGSFPLAIAQGASYLRHGYKGETSVLSKLQRYKEQYSSHEVAILMAEDGMKVREYGLPIITTWDMSFEVIVSNNQAAAELLLLFGFFHHNMITPEIFFRAFQRRHEMLAADGIDLAEPNFSWLGRFLIATSNGSWDHDFRFDVALSLLESYSLVQRTTGGAWSVHPLVHLWTVIGKQHPRLSVIEERARLALSLLGGMYDRWADSSSKRIHEMRMRMRNHMTSVIKTVQRYTMLLKLHFRSAVKAATLLRVNHVFNDAVQTHQQRAERLGTRLTLQAFVVGCVRDGIDHISTLQSFRAVILFDFNKLGAAYSEDTTELMEIPWNLLPLAAANDPDVELAVQQLSFRLTLLTILKNFGQYEKINDAIEETIQFADEHELEIDEAYRLISIGSLLNSLTTRTQLDFQSDESKRFLLRRLQAFLDDCQSALGESHKTTVEALLGVARMYREFGDYEKASHLLKRVTSLYEGSPETLADAYQMSLIHRTGLALKTNQISERIRAFSQLVEITSKTVGPFHSDTIGHKLSLISSLSWKASTEGSMFKPLLTELPGTDDAIWKPIGLALAYKYAGEVKEIDALWDGVIEQMLLEDTSGVDMDSFIYAFEVAAEESKRSKFQEASNIMQRHVVRLRDIKSQITSRIGSSKSALFVLLKEFWILMDSIGPFASPAKPLPVDIDPRENLGVNSPSTFNTESGDPEEQESRRELGKSIITKIRSAPNHARPCMFYMCVHSLELYYYGEKTRESAPLDARSIDLLLKMVIKQFGEAHDLSLHMHFVNAITSQLSNLTTRREESEACIMEHRFKDISRPRNSISLGASSVFERLNLEYRKRGWYSLCKRLYEITFKRFCASLGLYHEDTMRSVWFLLEMCWRVDGKPNFCEALKAVDTLYQRTEPNWKETFFVRMRQGGQFLLGQNLPEPASLVLRQVLEWVETFPEEKRDAKWMAQTWRHLGNALDALGDEKGATDSEIQARIFDAKVP